MNSESRSRIKRFVKWLRQPATWVFIAIFLGGVFFRFYGTPDRFGFDKDPTRDALVSLYGARHLAFPLVGPASGIASFTFGPWYYYELIVFSLLVPISFAPFYFIPLFSLSLILLMYFIGRELWDEYLGIILATFAAFSPSFVGPASGLSNPNLVAPHVAMSILIFILFLRKKRSIWLALIWGIVMGIGINNHYEMIPILILPGIYFFLNIKSSFRNILFFILGLVITFLPLLYFNLNYHWYTVNGILHFISSGGSNNYIPNSWHIYLLDFWPKFFGYIFALPQEISFVIVGIIVLIYGYHLFCIKKHDKAILILTISFSIIFIMLRYYNAERSYYYFIFLEPLLFVVMGFPLRLLGQNRLGKIIIILITLGFIGLSFAQNIQRTKPNHDQEVARANVQLLERVFPSKRFSIYTCQQKAIEKAQGVVVILDSKSKLSNDGEKIGFNNSLDNCLLPEISVNELSAAIYDFKSIPDQTLNKYGWYRISPETIFKNTVLWWTSEYEKI